MKDQQQSASPPARRPRITGATLAWAVVFGAYPFAGFLLSISPPTRKSSEDASPNSGPIPEVCE